MCCRSVIVVRFLAENLPSYDAVKTDFEPKIHLKAETALCVTSLSVAIPVSVWLFLLLSGYFCYLLGIH